MTEPVSPRPAPQMAVAPRLLRRRIGAHRGAVAGGLVFAAICMAVFPGAVLWGVDPAAVDLGNRNAPASLAHPLGTDQLGRDMMARVLTGGRISIAVGVAAMMVALGLGTLIGVMAGLSRRLDGPLMRLTDLFLSLPLLPLLLVVMMLFRDALSEGLGPQAGLFVLIVGAVGITSWMTTARIVRAEVLALKERDFIRAARAMGVSDMGLILHHILPNVAAPILVSASLGIASAILTESALSFLGLGFPPDFPTWGRLVSDAAPGLLDHPGRVIWPGMAISLTVLSVTWMADALGDALDPRRAPPR